MLHTQNYSPTRWLQHEIGYIKAVRFSISYGRVMTGDYILLMMSRLSAGIAPIAQRGKLVGTLKCIHFSVGS